jgi:uncharacterized membrane protein YbhN (UPF0104 family)
VALPDAGTGKRLSRTRLLFAAKIVFSLAVLALVLWRIPLDPLADTLRHAHRGTLLAAFGLLIASNVLGSYQWERLLAAVGIRVPFAKALAYYHVGLFFNNFLPANIGGDIARVLNVSPRAETRAAAVSAVVMDRLIGTVALAGLALVTRLPAIDRFHLGVAYAALVVFFVASVVMLWLVLHPRLLPALERGLGRIGLGRLRPQLDELAAHFAALRARGPLFAGLFAVATVIQVSRIYVHVLVARSLGMDIPVQYFLLFVPLLAVIVSLPISLNGIGVREGAGIVLFGLVGVERAPAFLLQFTTYMVAVAVSLLGALVLLARIPWRAWVSRDLRRMS